MTPAKYLSKLAKEYFRTIEAILKERGDDREEFSMELSQLANEFSKYHMAVEDQNENGLYVTFKTGHQQIGPWITIQKESRNVIDKLGSKFGLNPSDFEKLKGKVVSQEAAKTPLEQLIAGD